MYEGCQSGVEHQEQVLVLGGGESGGGELPFYHIPQQSRREKLRYPHADELLFMGFSPPPPSYLLNPADYSATHFDHLYQTLSLSSHRSHNHSEAAPVVAAAMSRGGCPVPAEPFTGYAAVLKGSRFLKPAQQMLEEICDVRSIGRGAVVVRAAERGGGMGEAESMAADLAMEIDCGGGGAAGGVKAWLISILDEVYRRYKQYCQQMRAVISAFESVAGLSNAAPYTCLAMKSISKHFQSLKIAISDQLRFANKAPGKDNNHHSKAIPGFGLTNGSLCYQGVSYNNNNNSSSSSSGTTLQAHVWRPQRGLPESAVAVLKAWLFEHFLHPYPTDTDKHMLAKQTDLSRNQVSNWFINARVRLWKPMVEEIHSLELREARKTSAIDDCNGAANRKRELLLHAPPAAADSQISKRQPHPIGSPRKSHSPAPKRLRNELAQIPSRIEEPVNFPFDDFPDHHRLGVGNGGVSLTLGLQQNIGVCLAEPLPLNVARRFGLEDGDVSYVMTGFEEHGRQVSSKDISQGQALRDFIG